VGIDMPGALVILGVLGTICTGIVKMVPRRENGRETPGGKYVATDTCEAIREGFNASLCRLEKDMREVKADVKSLLQQTGS